MVTTTTRKSISLTDSVVRWNKDLPHVDTRDTTTLPCSSLPLASSSAYTSASIALWHCLSHSSVSVDVYLVCCNDKAASLICSFLYLLVFFIQYSYLPVTAVCLFVKSACFNTLPSTTFRMFLPVIRDLPRLPVSSESTFVLVYSPSFHFSTLPITRPLIHVILHPTRSKFSPLESLTSDHVFSLRLVEDTI